MIAAHFLIKIEAGVSGYKRNVGGSKFLKRMVASRSCSCAVIDDFGGFRRRKISSSFTK